MRSETHLGGITPSKENYLKVLLDLSNGEEIHSIDVANALGITKASVSYMMNRLKEEGYITKEKYGTVTLTKKGIEEAILVKRRYNLLKRFFEKILGVKAETAAKDACRIEHIISSESIDMINEKLNLFS